MTLKNRWFLLFAGILSAALVFGAACGGDDDGDGDGGGNTPAAGQTSTSGDQAPADQQKITVQSVEPQFYDPHRSNFEQDIAIARMQFRGLYNLVDDGSGGVKVVNAMAAGEPTINGNVYTIKLDPTKKWSDGKQVVAADFVYGIQRECDAAVASPYQYVLGAGFVDIVGCDAYFKNTDASQAETLKAAIGVKAVDDTTLEITVTKPTPTFKTVMALWAAFPSREDVITAKGDAWTDPANIVVNGPFKAKEIVAKDHITLVPNPEWTGQKPALQEITIKFIDDLSAAFKAFQTGELMETNIQATDVSVAEGDSALKDAVLVSKTARITAVEVQMENEALSDLNLRMALSRSIDREALVNAVYDGVFAPATYWVVEGLTGHQGNAPFEDKIGYDVDAAKAALKAYTDSGKSLPTLRFTTRDTAQRRNEADFLQKAWKDTLGIDITTEFVDSKTRSQRFNDEDFDLFPGGWQLDYPDIENPLLGLFNTGGGNNHYNCSNPDVDAAFDRAAKATDEEARIKAYQDAETAIVTNLCGAIPIYQDAQPFLVSTKLGGVTANGTIDAGQPGNWCVECWFVKK
jgi:oligopeptide transport system substrate-binding protein